MIDLRRLRDEPAYREGIERKRCPPGLIDAVLEADEGRRSLLAEVEAGRAEQNAASREIANASSGERPARIAAATALKATLAHLQPALAEAESHLRELALQVPNPADPSVPDGGEDDAEVLRVVGNAGPAPLLDHAAFGEHHGLVELERAARTSGARFAYLMGQAVLVELALVAWVTQLLVEEGFCPVVPPVLVREEAMEVAGFFPTDRNQVYEVDGSELFLVGTSEIPLAGLHREEILEPDHLPLRYAGLSACFRREAGTYGRDTRGIFRVHQFDKVEMFSYADPDGSVDEHQRLLAIQERIVSALGLPYRVVNIAAGDLGAAAASKFDIEVWLPSEGRYRELTSCSNYGDYSARRLGTRVRSDPTNRLVHTLNGTACAVGRTLLFLFENHQTPQGTLRIPQPLVALCGFEEVPSGPRQV